MLSYPFQEYFRIDKNPDRHKISWRYNCEISCNRRIHFLTIFFCPALISPKNYDLLDEHPDTDLARDLTLIAKTIQCIANFIEFSTLKEPFMEPINDFLLSHFDGMKMFLDELCTPPNTPVDVPPPNHLLNFGREMSRVHYHCQTLIAAMREKFGETDEIDKLTCQILKINDDTQLIITEENIDMTMPNLNNTNNQENNHSNNNNILTIEIPNNNTQPPLKKSIDDNELILTISSSTSLTTPIKIINIPGGTPRGGGGQSTPTSNNNHNNN